MSKETKKRKQQFLITFFDKSPKNEVRNINGFILFKHWDGNGKVWRVDIFTPESFKRMNAFTQEKIDWEIEKKDLEETERELLE